MNERERLSATIESDVMAAARQAVAEGRAASVSAWVNDAMRRHADHERRLRALDAFVQDYEQAHGVITEGEMDAAAHRLRGRAVPIRDQQATGP